MNNSKVIFSVILLVCITQSLDCARLKRNAEEEEIKPVKEPEPKEEPKPKEPKPKEPKPKEPEPKEPEPPKSGGTEYGSTGTSTGPDISNLLSKLNPKELISRITVIFKKIVPKSE
ncbi:uncharacterized protein [Maniola hyperantus]|uniref:uncharacterized protein n=1 Tax=Aphantopus hyperantus TaxID=2795564 RepID=UPI002120C70D